MAKTFPYLALAYLTGTAFTAFAEPKPGNMRMTGLDLSTTSGTLELQRVKADRAVMSDDGLSIITERLSLQTASPGSGTVKAEAETGVVVIGGAGHDPKDNRSVYSMAEILAFGNSFNEKARRGDMLLESKDSDIIANVADRGAITSRRVVWSDELDRFFLPGFFRQEASTDAGSRLSISGSVMTVDRTFTRWQYYAPPGEPTRIEFDGGDSPPADKKPSRTNQSKGKK